MATNGSSQAASLIEAVTLLAGTTATNFTYDTIYELLTAKQGSTTQESYTYDPVGNRLTDLGSAAWGYNTSNELNSRPNYSYTDDANGNTLTSVVTAGTTMYAWDFENRLSSVTLPGSGGICSFRKQPLFSDFSHIRHRYRTLSTCITLAPALKRRM